MAGRPRTPTHLKVVAGTDRADRRHTHEPKPRVARLAPPSRLSPRAKRVWAKAAKLLHEMGVLTIADGVALEQLCNAVADLEEARASLAQSQVLVRRDPISGDYHEKRIADAGSLTYITVGQSGPMIRMRPEVAAIADADRRVSMWLAKFGLTPADRSRVGGAPPETMNPFDAF